MRSLVGMVGVAVLVVGAAVVRAQVTGVTLRVDPADVGLSGVVRPGTWAPMRLTLRNQGAQPRPVVCQWLLRDFDGDHVIAQRQVTLNPNRDVRVWLYAPPAVNVRDNPAWTVRVLDAQSRRLLASQVATPAKQVPTNVSVIGVLGNRPLGLEPYTHPYTQHEKLALVRGLNLTELPDRWYGLSLLEALIWTRQGGDPNAAEVTPAMQQAVREWVRRGGHLVLVLPPIGEPWTGSPLGDLMPVSPGQMRRVQGRPPAFLADVFPMEPTRMQMLVFDDAESHGLAVLERLEGTDAPVIVAQRYGFGRVTVVGVDLAAHMPSGRFSVWNTIFGWNSPVFREDAAEAEIRAGRMSRPENRLTLDLGQFIPRMIAMTSAAVPALLLAVPVFGLYWLAAGPVGFALLRHRGAQRWSWVIFVGTVGVFTVVTWGGAYLMQPRERSIRHFTVLDIDAGSGQVHVHGWLSLFVPAFGRVEVAVDPEADTARDVIAAAGLRAREADTAFLDPQSYVLHAARPATLGVPFRSTAKQFEMDYLGTLPAADAANPVQWIPPQGSLEVDPATGFPVGKLQHDLPGTLRNLLIVYCPGRGFDPRPWVWRYGDWAAGEVLTFGPPTQMMGASTGGDGAAFDRLVTRRDYDKPRVWASEGFLGQLLGAQPGNVLLTQTDPFAVALPEDQRVKMIEALSFYSALPPPDYRSIDFTDPAVSYQRTLGRTLDLAALTVGRRVILISHLESSPLPAPLTVGGEPVESNGWTVVRWIYDLQ